MFLTIFLALIVIIALLLILLLKQPQNIYHSNKQKMDHFEPYALSINSPLKSISFEEAATLAPLLENMKQVAENNATEIINKQLGFDAINVGSNSITYAKQIGEYIVTFSKEVQSMLEANKLSLMRDTNGRYIPKLIGKDGKIIENARILNKSQKLLSTVSKLSSVVVSAAHIISGADNAKKLKEI